MTDILVGTTKGLFILAGGRVTGPFCDGWPINHAVGDAATGRIFAAGGSGWHGAGIWRRDGGDWSVSTGPFPGAEQLWSVCIDGSRVLAGSKPAYLFESRDGGVGWQRLDALTDQPGAEAWQPGAAGLTLHTILSDGDGGIWVGISAAGVFQSRDGGQSWVMRNRRGNRAGPAGALSRDWGEGEFRREDEIFSCVHNLAFGAAKGLIYMQNHQGVYRSRNAGEVWEEVTEGLPSTFGFPVAAHPRDPGTFWVFPLNGDSSGRYPVDGRALVWKTTDGGETWAGKGQGLPAQDCFFTVLRQAMASDAAIPCGVAFGTNSGSVFLSGDEGETWDEVARHLPTVLSVEFMA